MLDNSFADRSSRQELEKSMQITCKQILEAKVFKGSYQESRHIEVLGGCRDIIVCESEKSFIDNLNYVKDRISKFYPDKELWIGVSNKDMIGAPAGTCIWTEVTDLVFGQYLFKVDTLQFRDNEVIIKLNVTAEANENPLPNENEIGLANLGELVVSWWNAIDREIYEFLYYRVTRENIIATTKYILPLALSLLKTAIEFLKFMGPFSLLFMAEIRKLLIAITPIILKLLDLLGKFIGAVFIFLAMIYRDLRGHPVNIRHNYKMIESAPKYYRNQPRNDFLY